MAVHKIAVVVLLLASLEASAQPSFPEPKKYPPDDATLKEIAAKTAELKAAVAASAKPVPDVEIYLKAAVWIVRHEEWYAANSGKQTLDVLTAGLNRAKAAKEGKKPWLEARGKSIGLGFRSNVDGSVQPYSLAYPADYDPNKKYWLEVVLHGRDGTLTEVKFLAGKEAAKPNSKLDHFVCEVYGRGNNAYRWAGETDVTEAIGAALSHFRVDRVILRGFSMGGAGTWHYGLHHPDDFAAIGPGAGFTTTRGYIKNLPERLPEYIEKCLHIYDAVDYAENVFLVPTIAYSGENDPQKAAADNIEKILKNFREPHTLKHLVAPGLEHQQPAEWLKKCDDEYRALLKQKPKSPPDRVRFVMHTTAYSRPASWVSVDGLEEHYSKAIIDSIRDKGTATVSTHNIRRIDLRNYALRQTGEAGIATINIDGQTLKADGGANETFLKKVAGKWAITTEKEQYEATEKKPYCQGPIDDVFHSNFRVIGPTEKPWNAEILLHTALVQKQFAELWDKHLRGRLPTEPSPNAAHRVLFGDPGSNPEIAKFLPNLPIQWTKDEIVVNGAKYDAKTHYPAMIYPDPGDRGRYVVLNSGHTFKDADFRGTNALLYPRLGDWAVLKPKPTQEDPGAVEVVAAGIFDEFWQFKKEKK